MWRCMARRGGFVVVLLVFVAQCVANRVPILVPGAAPSADPRAQPVPQDAPRFAAVHEGEQQQEKDAFIFGGTDKKTATTATQRDIAPLGFDVPCDLTAERGICLFNGQKVIVPDAVPKGLVASYTFDDSHCLDHSRHKNHGVTAVPAGPGRNSGYSAWADGQTWMEVPDNAQFRTMKEAFSITFWVFLTAPATSSAGQTTFCPLACLGKADAPHMMVAYSSASGKLLATSRGNTVKVESKASLVQNSWYHIAVTQSSGMLTLYVNGINDGRATVGGPPPSSTGEQWPFYLGRTPAVPEGCSPSQAAFFDDLRLYNFALDSGFIEAESFGALGPHEAGLCRLGCKDCVFDTARDSCTDGYHLCYENELLAGCLAVGRKMGWTSWKDKVWRNDVIDPSQGGHKGPKDEKATAFCCNAA